MKLNRHNYEEYFILYLDNELSAEDRREVELFVQENADLKAELDILLQTKLIPDTDIKFVPKAPLMVRDGFSISLNNYQEWILSYIDNELTTEENAQVEQFLASNPAIEAELRMLQQTKLQPESIVFPNKESLYRKEEKAKVISIRWRRIAVAAALLIGVSTTALILINNRSTNGGVAKVETIKPGKGPIPPAKPNDQSSQPLIANNPPSKDESIVKETTASKNDKEYKAAVKEENIQPEERKIEQPLIANNGSNNLPKPVNNPNIKPEEATTFTGSISPDGGLTNSGKNSGDQGVTIDPHKPYNNSEAQGVKPDDSGSYTFASEQPNNNKGIRGFLRKVTRTFEKRANIKTADDDDRLLIGGLALKMN